MRAIVKRVGRNIKRARIAKGWTQARLAERVGTGRIYLAHLEAGSKQCSLEMLDRIADALGVKIAKLVE